MKCKSHLLKVALFLLIVSLVGTIWKFKLLFPHKKSRPFTVKKLNTHQARLYALKQISGITLRHMNDRWMPADDVCYTGIVFPSERLTSTFANVTVYFHNEEMGLTTIKDLEKSTSWIRNNLNLLLKQMNTLTNASFIDIYAGHGLYSLPVMKLGRRVIAIEYRYSFAERLCRGIIAGKFREKGTIVNNIVSSVPHIVTLQPEQTGQRSLRDFNVTDDVFTAVSSLTLMSLLDRFIIKDAVLKMDMVNDALQTVMSSSRFFEEVKVNFILMEWSRTITSKDTNSLIDFLAKYDLVPCIKPSCRYRLSGDRIASWPAYIWWVNRIHLSKPHPSMLFKFDRNERGNRSG